MVLGATTYGFLVVCARALGPGRYGSLSALWALVLILGAGFFLPLQQEVARSLAARRAVGEGGRPVLRRAALLGASGAASMALAALVAYRFLVGELFDDEWLLLAGLVLSLAGYCVLHLVLGVFAGNGRFRPYALVLAVEGTLRLLGVVALMTAGVDTAGPYGLVIAAAPLTSGLALLWWHRRIVTDGPPADSRELSIALGWLLCGALLTQLLLNGGVLAVKLLAGATEQETAGRFLAGLIVARVPLFLFQAIQASLLPRLAELAARGDHRELLASLKRLLAIVTALGLAGTVGAFTVGPVVLPLLFGADFDLGRPDLTLLALGSGASMVAAVLAQALIALSAHARAALGWLGGVIAFVVVTVLVQDLLPRVELGFLAGSVAAAAVMAVLLGQVIGRPGRRRGPLETPATDPLYPIPTQP